MADEELAERIRALEATGVHNIAFVTGTHFVPNVLHALSIYRPQVPVVWNTGGYETVETIKMLEGAVDIYLPDLKLYSQRLGKVLYALAKSGLTPDAVLCDVETAMEALGEVTGRTVREDIVSRIFERFCVGK